MPINHLSYPFHNLYTAFAWLSLLGYHFSGVVKGKGEIFGGTPKILPDLDNTVICENILVLGVHEAHFFMNPLV